MTQKEYKSFMTEGYSIGAHAESLYSRGYKHYGTMGQGNKQVHIFTPAKGKVDHHMLLKHDGADPARHEGQPDLKKIKAMTEAVDVIAIQKERETKAQRKDKNIKTQNVRENEDDPNDKVDAEWRKVSAAREASRNAQKKKMNEDHLEEGWLFGTRYKRIGNKYATHRVTVKHLPTNTKHTFDVTAPTDRHAFDHVDRHMHGGRRGNTLSLIKIQHLHEEGKEVMAEALDIRHAINHPDSQARHHARKFKEHSKTANDIANMRVFPDQAYDYAHHYETAQHHAKKYKERLGQLEAGKNEDLQELSKNTLHSYLARARGSRNAAANRRDVADEKWEKANKAWRDGTAKTAHTGDYQRQTMKIQASVSKAADRTIEKRTKGIAAARARLTKEDLDDLQELSKKTLGSYVKKAEKNMDDTFKNEKSSKKWDRITWKRAVGIGRAEKRLAKNEDLQEISKGLAARYLEKAVPARDKARSDLEGKVTDGPNRTDFHNLVPAAKKKGKILKKRSIGVRRAQDRLKEDLMIDEGLVSRIKNAAKNLNKRLTPAAERIAKTREKVGYDNAKGTDLRPRGKALRSVERIEWSKQNPKKKLKDIVPMGKLPDKVWEDRNKFKNDHDDEVSKTITKHGEPSSKNHSYDSMSDHHVTKLGYPKKTVSVVTKRYKGGRLASHSDLTADSAHSVFVQNMKSEELEPNGSRKLLKELPKRDPKTGKLAKSKTAQKVEDCIKMSGKKEKIDTEPSYNPLTTAGGGGTPNA